MGLFLLSILQGVLWLAIVLIIANAIVSWLVAFGVFNINNDTMRRIVYGLEAVTDPILAPFRRFIPPLGGIDITPILAIIILTAAKNYLLPWLFRPIIGTLGG